MRDLYSILGISREADQASIRKAYKQLARKYHPDLNKDPGADDRFKEVTTAYEVLSDEQRRNLYDTFGAESLKQGFNPDAARQWRQATGGGFGGGFGGGGGVDIDDLLNAFGGRFGGRRGRPQNRPPPPPPKGADVEQALHCTIEEALANEPKVVEVRRPSPCTDCGGRGGTGKHACPACAGTGRTKVGDVHFPCVACSGSGFRFQSECETCEGTGRIMNVERLKVRLPAGVTHGQTIRLRGKGGVGVNGAPSGDLLLTVHLEAHERYEPDGHNLQMVVPLTVLEAMTGAKVKVPTPDGAIRVNIPAKSTSGTVMRIKGRGLPRTATSRGDLHLLLQVALPDDTHDARAHAEALDALYVKHPRADWD
ncbi:MAG: DnaJ C-terminal domain-containing protein [Myxococcota bacterium]|nr:DnaJ C-terminal domain-containing protein [Myxococcota bacterium]